MDQSRSARRARFEALYAEHFRPLLAYAIRRTAQPADAADVVADVFVVAWRRVEAVPDGEEARLWLYGVAHRVMANHQRGARRRGRLGQRLATVAERAVADHADSVGAVARVRGALERLPAADRELLRLAAWEGLTAPQIAVVLAIPPATVRTRLHRARCRLRDGLADSDADGDSTGDGEHPARPGHEKGGERPLVSDREGRP